MANITNAIQSLKPDAEFVITADDYSTIVWHKIEGAAPTLAQVKAEIKRLSDLELINETSKTAAKAALLERLGITEDEAKLLLS